MRFSRNIRRFSQPLSVLSCTDKLTQNDPGFVELSLERLGDEFDIDDFVYAARCNRTVKHVCFSGTFVRNLSPRQWDQLLEGVGHLNVLEELQIWCSVIPTAVLARMLQHATKLRKLYFFRVQLSGSSVSDFDALAQSIRSHTALRDLRIGGFQLIAVLPPPPTVLGLEDGSSDDEEEDDDSDNVIQNPLAFLEWRSTQPRLQTHNRRERSNRWLSLDCVLEAMAECPTLRVVSLQLSGGGNSLFDGNGTAGHGSVGSSSSGAAPFSGWALQQLLQSKSIEDMYLSRLCLDDEHVSTIASTLPSNKTLRVLDLFGNHLTNEHIVLLLTHGVQKNATLETLVLPCPNDDELSPSCAKALSLTLQTNRTLKVLKLPRSSLSDEGMSFLCQGLVVNTTLRKIDVGISATLSEIGSATLIDMLERNYYLERFIVSGSTASAETCAAIRSKVDYYMKLNEVGRGSLLQPSVSPIPSTDMSTTDDDCNTSTTANSSNKAIAKSNNNTNISSRTAWIDMLVSVRNDLDCLYYFINMNPTLCQPCNKITTNTAIFSNQSTIL